NDTFIVCRRMLDFGSVFEFHHFAVTESLLLLFRKFFAIYSDGGLHFVGSIRHKLPCQVVVFNDDFLLFIAVNLLFLAYHVFFSCDQGLFLVVAQQWMPLRFTIYGMYV